MKVQRWNHLTWMAVGSGTNKEVRMLLTNENKLNPKAYEAQSDKG